MNESHEMKRSTTVGGSFELDKFLPYKSAVLASIVSDTFAKQYGERFGISVYEWRCIAHLAREGELSVKDIAERANIDRASVTRAVVLLEARGFVSKVPNEADKRLVSITLNVSGRKLFDQISPLALSFEAYLVEQCRKYGFDRPHALMDVLIEAACEFNQQN